MNIKDYFESICLDDIKDFVEKQTTEDLYLEFKTANYPTETKFDNRNFSKCLSGFSNSLGGILIWGIGASKNKDGIDAANALKPIIGLIKFENHLKKIEGKSVVPLIEGVQYKRIEEEDNSNNGYLVVYIPQSEKAPHMAQFADKHYYKRSGESFYACEHFDIMDMLNRKISPKLEVEINVKKSLYMHQGDKKYYKYEGVFLIKNTGQVSIKFLVVYLKVHLPFILSRFGIDGNGNRGMKMMPTFDSFKKYDSGSELVIHPETTLEIDKFEYTEQKTSNLVINDLIVEYKVVA